MIQVKTMTMWPDEDYSYPLPDVSHIPEQEARELRSKGVQFVVFGDRDEIKSDVNSVSLWWLIGTVNAMSMMNTMKKA